MKSFRVNEKFYRHDFRTSDDSVVLIGENGEELIVYGSNCMVIELSTGKLLGHTSLDSNENWQFKTNEKEPFILPSEYNIHRHVEGLLDFEIEISKWYLTTYLKGELS